MSLRCPKPHGVHVPPGGVELAIADRPGSAHRTPARRPSGSAGVGHRGDATRGGHPASLSSVPLPSLLENILYVPLFFSRPDPIRSVFDALDAWFGVDLHSTWTLQFVRRSMEPLALTLVLLGWLSTSLITIGPFEEGIHERFGAPVSRQPLGPGLHLKAPWPVDVVHTVATARIRTMPLGYAGAKNGASMLWTRQHAEEEYNLLLGDGRDLVTINALLQYRISDAWTCTTEPRIPKRPSAQWPNGPAAPHGRQVP